MTKGTGTWFRAVLAAVLALSLGGTRVLATDAPKDTAEDVKLKAAIKQLDEYKSPGLESELSGIYPHPTDADLYYVVANQRPAYRDGQKPMLPLEYRGKLLTVDRHGKVVKVTRLVDEDYGDIAMIDGAMYVAVLNPPEIVKFDPESGKVLARIPLASPAGGLDYDPALGVFIAQLYVAHPELAVVNVKSGVTEKSLWSDESAMGLAVVDGDWLCTWASGWDPGSFSELRVLDKSTGKPRARVVLPGVHSSLSPAGENGFLALVTVNSVTGETTVRKYSYVGERHRT